MPGKTPVAGGINAMAETIEQLAARVDANEATVAALTAHLDAARAELAALKADAAPPPPETVICTDCLTEIPVADAENWPDPDQGGATRFRCKVRTPCKQRVKDATEYADEYRQAQEAKHAAAREALIDEARKRLAAEADQEGGEE